MNKDFYLCKEGACGRIDLNFLYPDWRISHYGLCCKECSKKEKCFSVCEIINHKHLKVEECGFRKNYKKTLEEILEDKREDLIFSRREIIKLEKEIADIEGRLNIKSPLDCSVCGSKKVKYNTMSVLLSCPPKYEGKCICGNVQYINTQIYKDLTKK